MDFNKALLKKTSSYIDSVSFLKNVNNYFIFFQKNNGGEKSAIKNLIFKMLNSLLLNQFFELITMTFLHNA